MEGNSRLQILLHDLRARDLSMGHGHDTAGRLDLIVASYTLLYSIVKSGRYPSHHLGAQMNACFQI
jgi:hypothetical protein